MTQICTLIIPMPSGPLMLKPDLTTALHQALDHNNDYAKTYINAIPLAVQEAVQMGDTAVRGLRCQLLYVLSNLTGWRGQEAREAKLVIKTYSKSGSPFVAGVRDTVLN